MPEDNKPKIYESPIKRHLVVGGVILFLILVFYLFTDYGAINRISYLSQKDDLIEKSEDLHHQIDSLKKLEKELITDTLAIERLAREKYGMIKKDETVIFIKKKKNDDNSGN